jgi:hypothetical protein
MPLLLAGLPLVALIVTGLLIVLAIRGSMRPGPTQLRQDADARDRRGQRSVNRRLRVEHCDDCGHPWQEHPGAPGIDGDICSECRYDVDHGTDGSVPPCRERVPSSLLQQP